MKCASPFPRRNGDGYWVDTPCGRCVACNVTRRTDLTGRLQLEKLTCASSHIMTLTFDDLSLSKADDAAKVMKNFRNACFMQKERNGIAAPLRLFAKYEDSGLLGRPHFHCYLGNMVWIAEGRHQFAMIPQWPHGHVDVDIVTGKALGYTVGYLDEHGLFDENRQFFRSRRPGLGAPGFAYLGSLAASRWPVLTEIPSTFTAEGRRYPLGRFGKGWFRYGYQAAGGEYRHPDRFERHVRATADVIADQMITEQEHLAAARVRASIEAKRKLALEKKIASVWAVYRRACHMQFKDRLSRSSGADVLPGNLDDCEIGKTVELQT